MTDKMLEESHSGIVIKADVDREKNTFSMSLTAETKITPALILQYMFCVMTDLATTAGVDLIQSLPHIIRNADRFQNEKRSLKGEN